MKRLRFLVSAILLAAASTADGTPALAGDPLAVRKEKSDRAFADGVNAFNKKDWKKAREKFTEAYVIYPAPSSLFNLALTEEEAGALVEALGHYRTFVGLPDSKTVAATRTEANARIAACTAKVCRLDVRAPASTSVRVNGKEATLQGSIVETLPGEQQVDLMHDGTSKSRRSACGAGETVVVEFSDPPSTVVIPAPTSTASTSASAHVPPPPPPATESVRPTAGYVVPAVLLGVSAVGLGGGIAFGVASNAAKSDAEALAKTQPCRDQQSASCTAFQDKQKSQDSREILSIMSYAASGVFLVGSVVSFLVWPKSTREVTSIRVAPTVGGLQMLGTF